MAITVAELVATLGLEDKSFRRGLGDLAGVLGSTAIIAGLNKIEQAASDLQQAAGGTEAVFGEMAGTIDAAAKQAAESMGLSERQFRESTSRIGALLKGMGYDTRAAADESIRLTQVGADLAATFGGTTAEAVDALAAALRGETDPIERYGISLRQADVDARALAMGLAESAGEIDANAKAQAALAIITEKSGGALGQFAREADSAAGQAQIAAARTENAQASMGEALLPIYAAMSSAVGDLAGFFGSLPSPAQKAIIAIAGLAAIAGPVNGAVQTVKSLATAISTAAENGSSLASGLQRMGPALAAAGIAAAGAAISLALWNKAVQEGEERASQFGQEVRATLASKQTWAEFQQGLSGVRQGISDLTRDIDNSSAPWDADYRRELAAGRDELEATRTAYERLSPVIEALGAETGDLDGATRTVLDSIDAVTRALDEGYTPAEAAAVAVTEAQNKETQKAATVQQAFGRETGKTTDEIEAQRAALEDLVDQVVEAYEEMFKATDANAAWHGALDDLTASIAENGRTLDLNTEQGRANYEAGRDVGRGLVDLMSIRFQETGSVQAATEAGRLYVEQLRETLRQAGYTEAEIDEYIATLGLVPETIATNFVANTADAVRAIQDLQRQAAGVAENSYEVDFHSRAPGARAAGGRVEVGQRYRVNELGQEWFVPDTAGTVVNAQQVRDIEQAMAAGPSGPAVEMTLIGHDWSLAEAMQYAEAHWSLAISNRGDGAT